MGLAETHLVDDQEITLPGFKWFGHNRLELHRRAQSGSGGVGFLIRDNFADLYNISVLDKTVDGMMWLKAVSRILSFTLIICVCYLPPEGSSRNVNAEEFMDVLMGKMYEFKPDSDLLYICGDFNARCGDNLDYIVGVDTIPDRQVMDYVFNQHGQILCDFLHGTDLCMLNGRNCKHNDFTFVSSRGKSVVDYCLLPQDDILSFRNFEVMPARDLYDNSGCAGKFTSDRTISDHSLIKWEMCTEQLEYLAHSTPDVVADWESRRTVYDLGNVNDQFFNTQSCSDFINSLDQQLSSSSLDNVYEECCSLIKDEMNDKLPHYEVGNKVGSKRKHKVKPFWNEQLAELWHTCGEAMKRWRKCNGPEKQQLRCEWLETRKLYDKTYQKEKRNYWFTIQQDLIRLQSSNPKDFWRYIKQIANEKPILPSEIKLADGTISREPNVVLERWAEAFESLLNDTTYVCEENIPDTLNENIDNDENFCGPITVEEISKAIRNMQNGKAYGVDDVPIEVIRNPNMMLFMCKFFNSCFTDGCIPKLWSKGVINPIPKGKSNDPRNPSSYRGITLTCVMYKVYCNVLNKRLNDWADDHCILAEEQNGFRSGRSCLDHLLTLTSVVQTRKSQRKDTYVAFVDFSKAYDKINRNKLWKKLAAFGINDKFLNALKALYKDVQCCVKVNGVKSRWFPVNIGLKQGCTLSPTLFNLYTTDLASALKSSGKGVSCDNICVHALFYADDICLMAESPEDLQAMLTKLATWCKDWDLVINTIKTQIVHFRSGLKKVRCPVTFRVNDTDLMTVTQYRYLGLVLNEFMDMNLTAKTVAQSAIRALGILITKYKAHGGMPYETYNRLFHNLVLPVLEYGSPCWAYKDHSCINAVQMRAGRFFLGVGRYTPSLGVLGEMGWLPVKANCWISIIREWCRLLNMEGTRLNYQVFQYAQKHGDKTKNLYYHINHFCENIGLNELTNTPVSMWQGTKSYVKYLVWNYYSQQWQEQILSPVGPSGGRNKLRTYIAFKSVLETEYYVTAILNRHHRSALAKFRLGVAPIRLETGRYEGLSVEERLCPLCNLETEDEEHVLLKCKYYDDCRSSLLNACNDMSIIRDNMLPHEKLCLLLSHPYCVKMCAKTCYEILQKRRCLIYSKNYTNNINV